MEGAAAVKEKDKEDKPEVSLYKKRLLMAKPKHIFGFTKKFDLTHFSKMAKLEQASSSSSSTVVAIAKKLGLRR